MSSSYPDRRLSLARAGVSLAALGVVALPALAAETYIQPEARVQAEVDSNRNLVTTGNKQTTEGYGAQAAATFGIATPRSETTIRPQIGYVDYPKDGEDSVQGLVDLASNYSSPRSNFTLYSHFDRRDTYSSELADANFSVVNPNQPTTPQTARITTNTTRTLENVVPTYEYDVTPRTHVGVSALYENADYTGQNAGSYVDYDYSMANAYLGWALNPRTALDVGVFGSRYEAKSGGATTDAKGANLAFSFKWSRKYTGRLEFTAERDEIKAVPPTAAKTRTNSIGATYVTTWSGQVSDLQLSVGRTFSPNGGGGKVAADQLQIEYNRKYSARFSGDYAARYIRYSSLDGSGGTNRYTTATAGVKWLATRTWYVGGGLEYYRVDYGPAGTGNNGLFYVAVGYQGLGRRP